MKYDNIKNDIQQKMFYLVTSEIEKYYHNINKSIDFILRNYIDKPITGKITKGKLRCRGIKTIVYDKNDLAGIIQRDNLITVDGYKVPCKNNHFCFEEKIKIEKVMKGDCFKCSCYDSFQNYCDYYKIMLNGNGYEPTCNNSELKDKIK